MNFSDGTERDDELAAFPASPVPRRVPLRIAAAARRQTVASMSLWFGAIFLPLSFPWWFWRDPQLASSEAR